MEQVVREPTRVDISNVKSVCSSSFNTYFLLFDGTVLYTGSYYPDVPKKVFLYYQENFLNEKFHINPAIFQENFFCDEIVSIINWQTKHHLACCLHENVVYGMLHAEIHKSEQDNFFDYYSDEAKISMEIYENSHGENGNEDSADNSEVSTNFFLADRFNQQFEFLKEMGQGGYGQVYQVKDKLDAKIWCIKIIPGKPFTTA